MHFLLLRLRAYGDPWCEYADPLFVWWWHVVIPDRVGRRCILFPSTLSTGDIQQISVRGLVLTRGFATMPVAARLLHCVVVLYVHVAFLHHKIQTQMSRTWAIKTWVNNRLDARSTNSPFLTWAIIAYYRKLGDALVAQIKDLCLGIFVTINNVTGYCI